MYRKCTWWGHGSDLHYYLVCAGHRDEVVQWGNLEETSEEELIVSILSHSFIQSVESDICSCKEYFLEDDRA